MDDLPERLDYDDCERHELAVDAASAGERIDRFLAGHFADFSRAALQRFMQRGLVLRNGAPVKPSARLEAGDRVTVDIPSRLPSRVEPQDLPLRVLLEDPHFVVLDKQPGLAVHPGRGRPDGTLANAIAFHYGEVACGEGEHRPGIVHRLDLETSGVMVVARSDRAHAALTEAFRERKVNKEYRALAHGDPPFDQDMIDLPLARDAHHPTLIAVRFDIGRESQTRVAVEERFGKASYLRCYPRTGRTHQIRVHLQSRGHPLLGDRIYARGRADPAAVPRLMLHAYRLAFPHPASGALVEVEAPLPEDFRTVLQLLRELGT